MQVKLWATTCYFWKDPVGPLGSISSTISIPSALLGQGRADGELLQRHSTDSAGAGKSRPSSRDGRRSAPHWSLFRRVASVQARRKARWEARCSRPGAGLTSAAAEASDFQKTRSLAAILKQRLLTHLPAPVKLPPASITKQARTIAGLEGKQKASTAEAALSTRGASLGESRSKPYHRAFGVGRDLWGSPSPTPS